MRRAIQRLIEDPLSEEVLEGKWSEGSIILVDHVGDELVFAPGEGEVPKLKERKTLALESAGPGSSLPPASNEAGAAE